MPFRFRWLRSIAEVPKDAWDSLAGALDVPILEWEWLRQLERSGSVRPETGWVPLHLTLWRGTELVGAAPLYAKAHSEGEFVWDHAWADVARRLGAPYYPKLVGMSPATPITGYRFLVAPGEDEGRLTDLLLGAIDVLCRETGLTGVSFPYADPTWQGCLVERGFLAWRHQSYGWENPGLADFEQYLAAFTRGQRRNIRRERAAVAGAGVAVQSRTGREIRPADLRAMYRFYARTNARFGPWAAKYLSAEFFTGLGDGYRHRLLLFAAYREGREDPLAMSLLLTKGQGLYGRFWGSDEQVDGLHFELCYYAPIQWAIEHGVRRFDPGIGGEHKVRRGFRAVPNHSLHRFTDPRLQAVMAANLEHLNAAEQSRIEALNRAIPLAGGGRAPERG
ncbi:MAG TPA: GNAT family N-acetyltransferase [Deferrisomatales bacterium]|nr:GNAT family N-acetyltransferase [Deferrisomatales bacterium]